MSKMKRVLIPSEALGVRGIISSDKITNNTHVGFIYTHIDNNKYKGIINRIGKNGKYGMSFLTNINGIGEEYDSKKETVEEYSKYLGKKSIKPIKFYATESDKTFRKWLGKKGK